MIFSGFWAVNGHAQQGDQSGYKHYFSAELLVGKTMAANEFFPDTHPQQGVYLKYGSFNNKDQGEWAYRLNYPKTGIGLGISNLGNPEKIGYQITAMPFAEFDLAAINSHQLSLSTGLGLAYFTKKYDSSENKNNRAVSTDVTWSFRLFFYYPIVETESTEIRLGAGYFHQSNGHSRFPNNGINSFLGSISANFKYNKVSQTDKSDEFTRSSSYFIMLNTGCGLNIFSENYNSLKNVYSFELSMGKKINHTFKIGVGFYYNFYQQYYDYISTDQSLVQTGREFSDLKSKPAWNASALGIFVSGEIIFLNHFALEARIGLNLHKPAYGIDWRYNEGWDHAPKELPNDWVLGEYNTKYKFKKLIASKMGLKYYLNSVEKDPVNNFYFAASINANLGQADFSELSLGYVYNFDF